MRCLWKASQSRRQQIWLTESGNPFAKFGGIVEEVTKAGRIIALIELFGRMTPVEFEAGQLCPAAQISQNANTLSKVNVRSAPQEWHLRM